MTTEISISYVQVVILYGQKTLKNHRVSDLRVSETRPSTYIYTYLHQTRQDKQVTHRKHLGYPPYTSCHANNTSCLT